MEEKESGQAHSESRNQNDSKKSQRTPHQCPHARDQVDQLALDAGIVARAGGTKRGLDGRITPSDCENGGED